ncbi:MAG TPA: aspartate carbamoyltransferase, partial [Thiotrichales bacterium]|nr:aspartate carbamoyltransferase [Thiotrichales bacterium]
AFILLFLGPLLGLETLTPEKNPLAWPMTLFGLIGIQTLALVLSTMHLGKPHRFYRAFNNLRYSPVSREVAGIAVFYNFLGAYTLLTALPVFFQWLPASLTQVLVTFTGWGAVLSGLAAIYFMHRIYRIPARPFWNHWQVLTSFYGSMLTLGPLLVLLVYAATQLAAGQSWYAVAPAFAMIMLTGLVLELIGLYFHRKDLLAQGGEGEAAYYQQITKFGKAYLARNLGLAVSALFVIAFAWIENDNVYGLLLWLLVAVLIVISAVVGRALFYALVIPTTMPGAFFWRNQGFQQHARETGLADMPQVGVLPDVH